MCGASSIVPGKSGLCYVRLPVRLRNVYFCITLFHFVDRPARGRGRGRFFRGRGRGYGYRRGGYRPAPPREDGEEGAEPHTEEGQDSREGAPRRGRGQRRRGGYRRGYRGRRGGQGRNSGGEGEGHEHAANEGPVENPSHGQNETPAE